MFLTPIQTLIMILAVALGCQLTRFLPFILFPEGKEIPSTVLYLGRVLPPAMIGFLVIYCIKGVSLFTGSHGIPELAALATVFLLQQLRGNVMLSIAGGTALYMFLVQAIFI